jgi:hypothetical protein
MILKTAKAALTSAGPVSIVPGLLRPIDVSGLIRELRLNERATERADANLPAADDDELDPVEREIEQRLLSEWGWQFDQLLGMLRAYRDRLAALAVSMEIGKLRIAAQHAIAEFRNADALAEGRLGYLKRDYIEARDELTEFRTRHRLRRPARPQADPIWSIGLLIFLIAIESAINGVFFAKGSAQGLVGGIGTAIGISGLNVIAAYLFGLFPARGVHHRNWLVKGIGLLAAIAGGGALVFLHLFAAHFREATAAVGAGQAYATALNTLLARPWGLTDINSWYLFGLGTLFGLSAFWKGYRGDDPYPGYGRVVRSARAAEAAYRRAHEGLFGHLARVRDATVSQLRDALQRIPTNVQQIEQAKAARSELVERFSAYEGQLEYAANGLLTTYREANKRRRKTPFPAHFEQSWSLPQKAGRSAQATALLANPDGVEQVEINAVLEELRSLSEEVIHVYSGLLTKFEHPTEMA